MKEYGVKACLLSIKHIFVSVVQSAEVGASEALISVSEIMQEYNTADMNTEVKGIY